MQLEGADVLQVDIWRRVQRVVEGIKARRMQVRQKTDAHPHGVRHDSPVPWWLIWTARH